MSKRESGDYGYHPSTPLWRLQSRMADDDHERVGDGDGADGGEGPGGAYKFYVTMENLLDKLKLLDYERGFCKALHMKALSRHYFAIPTNPGEQFHTFANLASWLIRAVGKQMDPPQEYDDPNATIASILDEIRNLGNPVDFPPSKLKPGCGEPCIYVLDVLADEALKTAKFAWKFPQYPEEAADNEDIIEGSDDESDKEVNEEEKQLGVDDQDEDDADEEENILGLDDLRKLRPNQTDAQRSKPDVILTSNTDSSEWLLEVERILPQLKVTIRADNKDWRTHVDQMHAYKNNIDSGHLESKQLLDRLYDEITRVLEKINSREKYLNSQLEPFLNEYRAAQDQLTETRERYKQASVGTAERTKVLAEITDELERIKGEMEFRGSTMTDGSPLVKIKQGIQRLKNEVVQMDIRIGVLEHILLQAKVNARTETALGPMVADDDGGYLF